MSKLYEKFKDRELITLKEIKKEFPKINHKATIKYLLKNEKWTLIQKGIYKNNNFYEVNKFILASSLVDDALLGYHAALEVWGVAQSVYNTVHILTAKNQDVKPKTIDGILYQPVKKTIDKGIAKVPMGSHAILCIDQERMVIDCIDKLKYVGGLEEYFKSISSVHYINEKKIIEYLKAYDKISLYHKVGFVLDHFKSQWNLSEYTLKTIENEVSRKKAVLLDSSKKEVSFINKWNLLIPKNFKALVNEY